MIDFRFTHATRILVCLEDSATPYPLGHRRQPVLDAEPRGGERVAQVFEPVRLAFDGPPQFVDPGPNAGSE